MRKQHIFLVLVMVLLTQACAVFKEKKKEPEKKESKQAELLEKQRFLIKATQNRLLDKPEKALAFIDQALQRDSTDFALYYERSKIQMALKDYENGLKDAQKAWQLSSGNRWAGEYLAGLNVQNNRYNNALNVYKSLSEYFPENTNYYLQRAQIHERKDNYKEAIRMYRKIIELKGIKQDLVRKIANMQLELGNNENAFKLIHSLINEKPEHSGYRNMLGEFHRKAGNAQKAINAYKEAIAIDSINGIAHGSLARIYINLKNYEKAYEHIIKTFKSPDIDAGLKISYYKNFYEPYARKKKHFEKAEKALLLLKEESPGNINVNKVLADFYFNNNKLRKARKHLEALKEKEKNSQFIWNKLFEVDLELNDYQKLFEHTNEALVYYVSNPVFYFYNGLAAYFLGKYQKAITSLEDAKALVQEKDYLLIQIHTFLGESYFELSQSQKAFKHFEQALSADPNNIQVLNNYSYYLALDSTNLDKAENMIKRVLNRKSESHIYMDTYGWILYKKGNYEKARQVIKNALQMGGKSDADILEHYGDILYKTGNKQKALDYWQKALDKKPGNTKLKDKIKSRRVE